MAVYTAQRKLQEPQQQQDRPGTYSKEVGRRMCSQACLHMCKALAQLAAKLGAWQGRAGPCPGLSHKDMTFSTLHSRRHAITKPAVGATLDLKASAAFMTKLPDHVGVFHVSCPMQERERLEAAQEAKRQKLEEVPRALRKLYE